MRRFIYLLFLSPLMLQGQGWTIEANNINPNNYFGVTVANGMIGLVSSPEPMKVRDVVLNGVYDYYQRGRVSNILKTFNHVNMNLEVDGVRINTSNVINFRQVLDIKQASLTTTVSKPARRASTTVARTQWSVARPPTNRRRTERPSSAAARPVPSKAE